MQEQTLFIHLMDIAYIRQDWICIRDSYPPFDEYSSYPMYGNILWYSLIKLYDSRQRNIMFYRPFDGDVFVVSYDKNWFVIRLADPSFLLCDPWDS